jgi:basic membrane protein A
VRRKRYMPWVIVVCALIAVVAATAGSAGTEQDKIRVAVITDIGGLNDKGFNSLSNVGRLRAQRQLGVETKVFITQRPADRLPNLRTAAQQGYDLIIGVGFLFYEDLAQIAPLFKDTKFAGVDVPIELVKGKPANVRGLLFKEQEAGYLVGYLAGLTIKRKPFSGQQTIGAIGANPVPAIVRFIAGYRAGAKKANPQVKVLSGYANDPTFSDQAKCKEAALNQIANGAGIIFQVAGGCGLGALDAAKEKGAWGIGVDQDQSFLGAHILTSATKKVDVSVYKTIQAYKANPARFRGGYNAIFDVKSAGVGYGKVSRRVPRADIAKLEAIRRQIAAGKIRPPQK